MVSFILENGGELINFPVITDKEHSQFNPSVCSYNNKLVYSLRVSDYQYGYINNSSCIIKNSNDNKIHSSLLLFDDILKMNNTAPIIYSNSHEIDNTLMTGIEDVRLFTKGGELYCQGTVAGPLNTLDIQIFKVNNKLSDIEQISDIHLYNVEKNWMYIPTEDEMFKFIYWFDKEIIEIRGNEYNIREYSNNKFSKIKGSSKLVPYKDGYLTIVHSSEYVNLPFGYNTGLNYNEYLVYLDKDLQVKQISDKFKLSKIINIEFSPGLEIIDNIVYISFSVYDSIPFILKFDIKLIDYILNNNILVNNEINDNEYTHLLTSKWIDSLYYESFFNRTGNLAASKCFEYINKNKRNK